MRRHVVDYVCSGVGCIDGGGAMVVARSAAGSVLVRSSKSYQHTADCNIGVLERFVLGSGVPLEVTPSRDLADYVDDSGLKDIPL